VIVEAKTASPLIRLEMFQDVVGRAAAAIA
jgi:hypothetical protein